MAEKETLMELQVDLNCPRCNKKIKKTLCKVPQVRDQVYDQKANKVLIKVVCCSPEKIRDKLLYKAGKVIKDIKIIPTAKPPKKAEPPVAVGKPNEAEKQKGEAKPKPDGKGGAPPAEKDKGAPKAEDKGAPKAEPAKNPEPAAKPPPAGPGKGPEPAPVSGVPSVLPYLGPSYNGYAAGPYYHGYGFPPPPQPCYEGYYVGYGGGRVGHVSRCDTYFSDENPQACSIM